MKKQFACMIILGVIATTAITATSTQAQAIARQPEANKAPAPVPRR